RQRHARARRRGALSHRRRHRGAQHDRRVLRRRPTHGLPSRASRRSGHGHRHEDRARSMELGGNAEGRCQSAGAQEEHFMTMQITPVSADYVEMRFGPRWTYISCVRKFVASFFMIGLADKERAELISMAASALLENAVK